MLLSPHTMVGLAIGAAIQNPLVAVPVAFVSHFIGDMVPHWDFFDHFPSKKELLSGWQGKAFFADIGFGIALGTGFTLYTLVVEHNPQTALNMFLCGLAAVTPDALYAPIVFYKSKNKIIRFFYKMQGLVHIKVGFLLGNFIQFGVLAAAFLVTSNLLTQ